MPPVRCRVQHDILRPPLDSPVKNRLQALVMTVVLIKAQVVAEQQEPLLRPAQQPQQPADRRQVLALQLHQLQLPRHRLRRLGMGGLDQARLAHAPRAPQQDVVRGIPPGELQRVGQQHVPRPVDAHQQPDLHPADPRHRLQPVRSDMPDKGLRGRQIRPRPRWRRHPVQRRRDPLQRRAHSPAAASSSHRPSARSAASRLRSVARTSRIEISYSG